MPKTALKGKSKVIIRILISVVILLSFAICFMGYSIVKLSRRNMYSKNIIISNNYIFSAADGGIQPYDYAESRSGGSVKYSMEVPYISQKDILPNGCEAVSAVMLLRYYGFDADPVDFSDNFLDKGEVYIKLGCRYGPDPKEKYAGDPKSKKGGWGCFAPVIVKALNKYLNGEMYARNLSGMALEEIEQRYIAEGVPVAIWVVQNMKEIDKLYQWQSYDKEQSYVYPVSQHCVVLTGFDEEYYYFNDPLDDSSEVKYEKNKVKSSYLSMGKQAAVVL